MIQITLTTAQNQWLEVSWSDVVDESKTEIKFVSYHPTQLSLLEADAALIGTSLDDHAQTLADWVAAYVPPPPEPVAVPKIVTMRQARLALLGAGKLTDVNNAINALPSPTKEAALIEWEFSNEVNRKNGLVSQLAPLLGMTDADLDAMFIAGAAL